jgi:hypothetical protein
MYRLGCPILVFKEDIRVAPANVFRVGVSPECDVYRVLFRPCRRICSQRNMIDMRQIALEWPLAILHLGDMHLYSAVEHVLDPLLKMLLWLFIA